MTAQIGRTLRQSVISRLGSMIPALDWRVYDKATETTPTPYVTLGPSYWVTDDADCIEGRSWTLQIDVWDKASNKGALEDLTDAVAAALRGYVDPLAILAAHPFRVRLVRVMDDADPDWVHGIVQVEIEVEGG